MGQIINRIINIAKSYSNDDDLSTANRVINSDEDNLKKIINDLNKKKESQKETFNSRKDTNNSNSSTNNNHSATDDKITSDKAYSILELTFNCSVEEIKSAYKAKIKEYHPDKVHNLGREIQELAAKKTKDINTAYSFLKQIRNF